MCVTGNVLSADQRLTSVNTAYYTVMQGYDGNVVEYPSGYYGSNAIWNTATQTVGPNPKTLIMQTDGNLVVYDNAGVPRWASNSNGVLAPYRFNMQDDKSNCVYDCQGNPRWCSPVFIQGTSVASSYVNNCNQGRSIEVTYIMFSGIHVFL